MKVFKGNSIPQVLGILVFTLSMGVLFSGCLKDHCQGVIEMEAYTPVYQSYDEFRSKVDVQGPKSIQNPGKIFYHQDYLYISDQNRGIHIVDNSNPEAPSKIAFVSVPGNIDLAIKENYLFVDSYMDLVVFDISSPATPQQMMREKDVFPYDPYQYTPYEGKYSPNVDRSKGVVVDWVKQPIKEEMDCEEGEQYREEDFVRVEEDESTGQMITSSSSGTPLKNAVASPGVGKGGSMARFTINKDYLYSVKGNELGVFDVSAPENPAQLNTTTIDWDIETIFSYEDNLFIGSKDGMHIYSINNPTSPYFQSTYEHVRQCDPVVVKDDRAYVTIRNSASCGGWENVLDVVDISDPSNPYEIESHDMEDPHGLGVTDSSLYLCEGDAGIKSFNLSSSTSYYSSSLEMVSSEQGFHAYDLIPYNGILAVTGEDGIRQYDYSKGPENLKFLSTMRVVNR